MSRQLLTPSPSPPPPMPTPTLPDQINSATRSQHADLNRLILDRLPRALPPLAADPRLLGYGLAAFAAIYFLFEDICQELRDSIQSHDKTLTGTHEAQVKSWLATLLPPGLLRSPRLRADLTFISDRVGTNVNTTLPAQWKTLRAMRAEILAKPHILIAYEWVMYMAIFSGGRWIRSQFCRGGIEFWTGNKWFFDDEQDDLQLLFIPSFSFLSFGGEADGEEIKLLFKARLAEAETLLTYQERQEVVYAAMLLFARLIELVAMIDRLVWWKKVWSKVPVAWMCIVMAVLLVFALLR